MREVPYPFYPCGYKLVNNALRLHFRDCYRTHVNFISTDIFRKKLCILNYISVNLCSYYARIIIKKRHKLKSAFCKLIISRKGSAKVADTNNYNCSAAVNPHYFCNFAIQIFNVIAKPLLTESSKTVKVLSYL